MATPTTQDKQFASKARQLLQYVTAAEKLCNELNDGIRDGKYRTNAGGEVTNCLHYLTGAIREAKVMQ